MNQQNNCSESIDRRTPRVFIVDDEEDICEIIYFIVAGLNYQATRISNSCDFVEQYGNEKAIIILDLSMPGMDGVEIIRYLASIKSKAQLILMSGHDVSILRAAEKLAKSRGLIILGTLEKPIALADLEMLLSISVDEVKSPSFSLLNSSSSVIKIEDLSDAIENREIKSYYQPKVEMTSCNIISLEALARWHHPKLGWIPPDEFIPLAEEHGLIGKLTSLMLDLALTACEELIFKGFSLNVAVNISAKSLGGLNFPDEINKKVQEHNLDTSKVVLEITESAITEDIANALDVMTRIRMKGIHLSIDDFGTGYSSIEMLHRYPFDELKVDRSFVSQMMTDHDASAIVETSIEISKKMNMKAVAEGVESKEIWAALRAMGCDEAQGDFICKAIPKESIPEWVSNWKKKTADLKLRLM